MANEARMSEEKAARSMIDAARLAEELRAEQDLASLLERDRKVGEAQVKDVQACVDEAEMNITSAEEMMKEGELKRVKLMSGLRSSHLVGDRHHGFWQRFFIRDIQLKSPIRVGEKIVYKRFVKSQSWKPETPLRDFYVKDEIKPFRA